MSFALPPLSRSAHDRGAERRDDAAWISSAWPTGRVIAISPKSGAPVSLADSARPRLRYLGVDELSGLDSAQLRLFLGEYDGQRYFAVPVNSEFEVAEATWSGLRDVGGELDDLEAGLLTSAVALAQWHRTHLHCPRCGSRTEVVSAGWSRRCPADGSLHFPRTDPAVIMLVHDGGERCVLGRQAAWPVGRFSVLAGFVEAGESAEAAVEREVNEEVGLTVTDVRYVASQPWPFPSSLMLGYIAQVTGDQTVNLRDAELAEADWFSRAEMRQAAVWGTGPLSAELDMPTDGRRLAALPGGVSIARQLVDLWLNAPAAPDGPGRSS